MKRRANWLFLLLLATMAFVISGCMSDNPDNASVRPWNAPQSWENGLGGMDSQQHP